VHSLYRAFLYTVLLPVLGILILCGLLLLLLLLTAIEFSLGGSSPYTSTGKTNKNINETIQKTQYRQYRTQ
jgi:hypothetical protein